MKYLHLTFPEKQAECSQSVIIIVSGGEGRGGEGQVGCGGGSMLAGEEMVPQHVAPAACIQISWTHSAQAQTLDLL